MDFCFCFLRQYGLNVWVIHAMAGPKDCDLPKAALSALHAGVNSFGQLTNGPHNGQD
ncbi:hypothetical protein DOY81_002492, partial [Sarcophaga bullata]